MHPHIMNPSLIGSGIKHSAYRSMQLAKEGKTKNKDGNLKRWIQEDWRNLTPYAEGLTSLDETPECGKPHPEQKGKSVCRPMKKVNEQTPNLASTYSKEQIKKAVELKNKGETIKWDDLTDAEGGFKKIKLRTIICRIGNKMRYIEKILPLIPEHKTYVEPFVGSGAVLVSKEPSEKEIINDLDDELIKDWKLLKTTKYQDIIPDSEINTIEKMRSFYKKNVNSNNNYKKLASRLMRRCALFSGKDNKCGSAEMYRYSNINNKMKELPEYNQRLKNVKILNKDYKDVIKEYDSSSTFFFLDPPYEDSSRIYTHGDFDFEELKNILSNIKGKFLLTLNDSSYIRNLFKSFNIKSITLKSVGGLFVGAKPRKELLIRNY